MPVGAAKDLLLGWQIRNLPATGGWRFLGAPVDPRRATAPALVFCGRNDTIAPPPLADPLGRVLPDARAVAPPTGHVGMIVGSAARSQVWRPIAEFLAAHAG
jgi:poly[(R)-3-hydroxyalkanoate] polymerase subunit PhaC